MNNTKVAQVKACGHSLTSAIAVFVSFLAASGRTASTIECYYRVLSWLVELIGDVPVNSIQAAHLEQVIIGLQQMDLSGLHQP